MGLWIGGVWNGHFPESEQYFSEAKISKKIHEIPQKERFLPKFRLRNFKYQSPKNAIPYPHPFHTPTRFPLIFSETHPGPPNVPQQAFVVSGFRWAKSHDSYHRSASESYRCDSNRKRWLAVISPSETQKLVLIDPAFAVPRFESRAWRSFVQRSFHKELWGGLQE